MAKFVKYKSIYSEGRKVGSTKLNEKQNKLKESVMRQIKRSLREMEDKGVSLAAIREAISGAEKLVENAIAGKPAKKRINRQAASKRADSLLNSIEAKARRLREMEDGMDIPSSGPDMEIDADPEGEGVPSPQTDMVDNDGIGNDSEVSLDADTGSDETHDVDLRNDHSIAMTEEEDEVDYDDSEEMEESEDEDEAEEDDSEELTEEEDEEEEEDESDEDEE